MTQTDSPTPDNVRLTNPDPQSKEAITGQITEQVQNTSLDDIELRICAHTKDTDPQTQDGEYSYTYQPGSLWLTFNDEFNVFVMQTPGCDHGTIAQPTGELPNARPVSEHFYYQLYEALERTETEIGLEQDLITVDDSEIHVTERFHLQELLLQAFSPDHETGLYTDLILQKARTEFDPTAAAEPDAEPVGDMGGLEEELPRTFFESSTEVKATDKQPLAPIDHIFAELYNANGADITIATPFITDTISTALSNAAESESSITILVSEDIVNEVEPHISDIHSNVTVTVPDARIQAPVITIGDTVYVLSLNENNMPAASFETADAYTWDWAETYFAALQDKGEPITALVDTTEH